MLKSFSVAVLVASLLPLSGAGAAVLSPRGTAKVEDKGSWSVGIFAPLRVAFADGMEVEFHPLVAPAAPHATLRLGHGELGPFRLAGEYSLSVPTPAMRLLKGFVFPEWEMSDSNVGWFVVPAAAIVASTGESFVTSIRLAASVGIPLGPNDAIPLDSYAPLDLLLAPMLQGYRLRAGVSHDHPITDWLRVRGGVDLWLVGRSPEPPRSPVFFSARMGVDLRLGSATRLALGAAYFNSDQRRTAIRTDADGFAVRHPRRTNDFFPTFDLIWER